MGRKAGAGSEFVKDRFAGKAVGARVLSRLERVSACREVWGEGSIVQGEVAGKICTSYSVPIGPVIGLEKLVFL